MNTQKTAALMAVYSVILVISSILYIALVEFSLLEVVTCFIFGAGAATISYFMLQRQGWAFWAGLSASFVLMLFAGWMSIKALYQFSDSLQNDKLGSLYDEGSAFFIMMSVFMISMLTGAIQVMLARSNARELNN